MCTCGSVRRRRRFLIRGQARGLVVVVVEPTPQTNSVAMAAVEAEVLMMMELTLPWNPHY